MGRAGRLETPFATGPSTGINLAHKPTKRPCGRGSAGWTSVTIAADTECAGQAGVTLLRARMASRVRVGSLPPARPSAPRVEKSSAEAYRRLSRGGAISIMFGWTKTLLAIAGLALAMPATAQALPPVTVDGHYVGVSAHIAKSTGHGRQCHREHAPTR